MLGIARTTSSVGTHAIDMTGEVALQDQAPLPGRVWNRIPDTVRDRLITLALNRPELSPRELAVTFTDTEGYFVCESSVYRLLKAHDLITSAAFIVIKGRQRVHRQDHGHQSAVADGFYLPEDHWLGAGWFYPRYWMTFHAMSWPGSCVRP